MLFVLKEIKMKKKHLDKGFSKVINCLGWCNKTFLSSDPINTRFCQKCKDKRNSNSLSKIETQESRVLND